MPKFFEVTLKSPVFRIWADDEENAKRIAQKVQEYAEDHCGNENEWECREIVPTEADLQDYQDGE